MPLNRYNTRDSHRKAFAGITEYVTLRRRGTNGKFTGVEELWIGQAEPSTESGDGDKILVERGFKLFRIPGRKYQAPHLGDQIVRTRLDLTVWDIKYGGSLARQMFGNYCYHCDTVQVVGVSK